MTEAGIIVLNYNTFTDSVACVDSIIKNTRSGLKYRIYLIDNASPDRSGMKLAELYRSSDIVQVICLDVNGGFSVGNNAGIGMALGDGCQFLFLLNSDIIIENDAISLMAEKLKSDDTIAAIGPAVFDRNGSYTQFARKALTYGTHLMERFPFLSDRKVRRYAYDSTEEYIFDGMSAGCCFGMNAAYLGELDDRIFMYYEEDILAHKMKLIDKKACVLPSARVVHNEGVATKKSVIGKASFEKMYRWTSAMYVLKEYAGASRSQMLFLRFVNILEWKILSLFQKEYKDRELQFRELVEKYSRE